MAELARVLSGALIRELVTAISINPLRWAGDAASAAAGNAWKAAMIGLWSAGLWLLQLAFRIIDSFTTPDMSAAGPMAAVMPTTLWLGGAVVVLTMFLQLGVALIRRDGESLGRIFIGVGQWSLVWVGYLGVASVLVVAASGLTKGLLAALLDIGSWREFSTSASWPRNVSDTTAATVLGMSSLLLIIPASFTYVVVMLVRAAALILLVATSPITAAGLVNDSTKVWFWKSLRWFIASLLIAPTAALILGIGVKLSAGVVSGAGDQTAAAVGMAVIGAVLIAIGAICPLLLFRLLAFVEPGTASGAALRQSWADAGGVAGLAGGSAGRQAAGSAATQTDGGGRSAGEAAAESQGQSRLTTALGAFGHGVQKAAGVANRAADIGSDVLGAAGVGHPGYSMGFADNAATRHAPSAPSAGRQGGGEDDGGSDGGEAEGPPEGGAPPPLPPPVLAAGDTDGATVLADAGRRGRPGDPGPGGSGPAAGTAAP